MRTMLRNFGFCCLAALSVGTSYANAQSGFVTGDWVSASVDPNCVPDAPQSYGSAMGVAGRAGSNLQLMNGNHFLPMPGRIWFEANIGDGLGYEGTYFTLGGKTHLADDFLDGRWLLETQGHISENGGLFTNLGLERVFSLKKHGADLTLGAWLDYDGDENGGFGHSFWQGAINGSVRTDRWDVVANGYMPFGETVYTQGSLDGISFFQNGIALQAGLDTALQGYDVTFRARPLKVAHLNGFFDLGAYGYESDAVRYFTGARVRTGLQLASGWRLSGEVNRDDVFEWTGVLQVAYVWGANDRGTYSGLGNDLDPTMRNDHIVRFQQDLVLAVDPDTGAAYNVIHVDNSSAGPGNGTFENRFSTLAQAQGVASTDDIIFVHRGDGTSNGYDTGFVMLDRQFLLGDGVAHLIPVVGGNGLIQLPNTVDGNRPVLTNPIGPAITINGSDTVIRGFEIDGSGATTAMSYGIFANGLLNPIDNFRIEDVFVHDADLDGIHIRNAAGDLNLSRIDAESNGRDGLAFHNFGTSDSDIALRDITAVNNGEDGIQFNNFDAATMQFTEEILADDNGQHGVNIENFVNSSGTGLAFSMIGHTFQNNVGDGLRLNNLDGNFLFQDLVSINNGGNGLTLLNVRNSDPMHSTLITSTNIGTTSIFALNNGTGVQISLTDPGSVARVLVEQSVMSQNLNGFIAEAEGIGTFLTTNVINNLQIANNEKDGVTFRAINGALHNAILTNTAAALSPLNVTGNGAGTGNGVSLFAGDLASPNAATLNVLIEDVDLSGTGGVGIFGATGNLGLLNAEINNVTIDNSVQGFAFDFGATNPALISRVSIRNSSVTNIALGMLVNNGAGSSADILVDNVVFRDDAPVAGEAGVLMNNFGNLRLNFTNSSVTTFDNFGFLVQTGGNGRTLANVAGNTFSGNGPLNVINGLNDIPHEDNVRFFNAGSGVANIRFVNNVSTGAAQQGLNLTTTGSSELNILMDTNIITGNDLGDNQNPPPIELLVRDMLAVNGVGSTMCIAMSSNAFGLPADLINNSGLAAGILELDGLTNGIGDPTAVNFTLQPFGSTCEPAIEAEEAAFDALGF